MMNPVLVALCKTFVGGELEVQNNIEGYAYRGQIATVEFTEATADSGALMKVTLAWNAKAAGRSTPVMFLPTGGWDENTTLEYTCNTDLPSPEIDAPNIPNVSFIGEGRIAINNPYTGEMTVLFPKDGSKLSRDRVRWLPDGPKAKFDEEQQKATEARAAADAEAELEER